MRTRLWLELDGQGRLLIQRDQPEGRPTLIVFDGPEREIRAQVRRLWLEADLGKPTSVRERTELAGRIHRAIPTKYVSVVDERGGIRHFSA